MVDESITNGQAKTRVRRQWKSFNMERSFSAPGTIDENSDSDQMLDSLNYGQVVPALRSQLAEQGCLESQLYLARELLVQAASGLYNNQEGEKLQEKAVYWLLRASEQGSTEARETIVNLYREGKGITDKNYQDIAAVVNIPYEAVMGNSLGKVIFNKLSQGYSYVTPRELARLSQPEIKRGHHVLRYSGNAGKISIEELSTAGCQYMEPTIPQLDTRLAEFRTRNYVTDSVGVLLFVAGGIGPFLFPGATSYRLLSLFFLFSTWARFRNQFYHRTRYSGWSAIFSKYNRQVDVKKQESLHLASMEYWPSVINCFGIILILGGNAVTDSRQLFLYSSCLAAAVTTALVLLERRRVLFLYPAILLTPEIIHKHVPGILPGILPGIPPEIVPGIIPEGKELQLGLLSFYILYSLIKEDPRINSLEFGSLSAIYMFRQLYSGGDFLCEVGPLLFGMILNTTILSFRYRKSRAITICFLILLTLSSFSYWTKYDESVSEVSDLSWSDYHTLCRKNPSISTTATCYHLSGLLVNWSGEVDQQIILERNNWAEELLKLMPLSVATMLTCLLGDRYKCGTGRSEQSQTLCRLRGTNQCHLEAFSQYRYQIRVKMSSKLFGSPDYLELILGHSQASLTAQLTPGSQVSFTGRLQVQVTGTASRVYLEALHQP